MNIRNIFFTKNIERSQDEKRKKKREKEILKLASINLSFRNFLTYLYRAIYQTRLFPVLSIFIIGRQLKKNAARNDDRCVTGKITFAK